MIRRMRIKTGLVAGVLLLLMAGCNLGSSHKESDEMNNVTGDSLAGKPDFEVVEHDFGTIDSGEEVGARFGYKNSGAGFLMIERVSTGCGCTVAEYSEKPLKKGETGFVEVIFDSRGKRGAQFQEVRVYFREHKKPVRLSIIAEVDKK